MTEEVAADEVAADVADCLSLKLYVPTGQKTIESDELIPCFAIPCLLSCIPCLGCYCSSHDKCGCAANNQCFCLSVKCKPVIKLLQCGKEKETAYFKIGFLKFIFKKAALHFDFELESWNMEKRNCLLFGVDIGCFKFEFNIDDGLGFYRPGCSKGLFCIKCQNKCCCCVQQSAFPCDSVQALACFGLACLPGCGCCKTVNSLKGKKAKKAMRKSLEQKMNQDLEMKQASLQSSEKKKKDELEMKQASLQSSKKKKKKDKVKIKLGVDLKGTARDMISDL